MFEIDKLTNKIEIVALINEYVQLRKAGNNYKGLCPFHSEDTPSFVVSPKKNIFKCFGCGESGDGLSFYIKLKKISFIDAVKELSKKYKVDLNIKDNNDNKKDHFILNAAAAYYTDKLHQKNYSFALDYFLINRSLSLETIKDSYLGYASENGLVSYLENKKIDKKDMLRLGLIRDLKNRYIDSFQNRVIFPILNRFFQVIGFGARAIDNNVIPKYINSIESDIFKKSYNLYGIFKKDDFINSDYIILVEGYMDVIALRNRNIKNVVASLGTSLTLGQAKLIKKLSNRVVVFYDNDEAGKKATERAIYILKQVNLKVSVVSSEKYKDPDEAIQHEEKDYILNLINESKDSFDYLYIKFSKDSNDPSIILDRMKDFFSSLNELDYEIYLNKLSSILNITKEVVKKYLNKKDILTKNEKSNKLNNLEIRTLLALFVDSNSYNDIIKYNSISKSKIYFLHSLKDDKMLKHEVKNYFHLLGYDFDKVLSNFYDSKDSDFIKSVIDDWKRLDQFDDLKSIENLLSNSKDKKSIIANYLKKRIEIEEL
jgi:DNA primase